jgi:hypothetical protein
MMNKSTTLLLGTILAAAALVVATLAVAPMQAYANFGDNQQSGSFNFGFSGNNANKGGRSGTVGCGSCFAGN